MMKKKKNNKVIWQANLKCIQFQKHPHEIFIFIHKYILEEQTEIIRPSCAIPEMLSHDLLATKLQFKIFRTINFP